jgi:hypothetical protein
LGFTTTQLEVSPGLMITCLWDSPFVTKNNIECNSGRSLVCSVNFWQVDKLESDLESFMHEIQNFKN